MKNIAFLCFIMAWSLGLHAQESIVCKETDDIAAMEAQGHKDLLQPRTNPYTNNYDLKYHRFEWIVDPQQYYIKGTVTSYFVPTETNFNQINFELAHQLTVNEVKYHGQPLSFTLSNDDLLRINLPAVLPQGILDSVSINYEGQPPTTGFGSFNQTFHNNTPIIWSLSEPYGSKDWWPSKMDLSDKIDSIDVYVRTPVGNRVASNGVLVSEVTDGRDEIFHWKHRYPITAYLIAIGVTNYAAYSDHIRLPSGDTLLILNYVYPEQLATAQSQTFRTLECMQFYNNLFGTYPYVKEKYGLAQFGFGGGEEHQTMTFLSGFSHLLQSHELAHQWFGDKVTCGSWRDIWLNEGFATYCEGLTQEAGIGTVNFHDWLRGKVQNITSAPSGPVWVDDTTSVNRIFNGRLSYDKGAMLLHMLRWKLGDSTFFQGIREYVNDPQLAYNYAKTDDLKRHLEAVSGQDLTKFFNDWFYGQGYPSYNIEVQIEDLYNYFNICIHQTTSDPSVDFFEMPVPLRLKNLSGADTTIVLNNTQNDQCFPLHLPNDFELDAVEVDPDYWLVSANNQVVFTTATKDIQQLANQIKLFPNPVSDQMVMDLKNLAVKVWQIDILDAKGSLVRRLSVTNNFETIDVSQFSSGIYALRIQTDQGAIAKTFMKQ